MVPGSEVPGSQVRMGSSRSVLTGVSRSEVWVEIPGLLVWMGSTGVVFYQGCLSPVEVSGSIVKVKSWSGRRCQSPRSGTGLWSDRVCLG